MKTFKVRFWLKGKFVETTLTASSYSAAATMVKAQYPEATNVSIAESR
jgi:hypothetical protein